MVSFQELSEFPQIVSELLDGLTHDQLRKKPTPEEFSFAEHVCHLRDIEREGYAVRIRRLLKEEHPQLKDIDGARLAIERDYNADNVGDSLQSFAEARRDNMQLLKGTDEEQLSRKAELEGVGEITLRRLVEMMHEHDENHLEEMTSLRTRLLRAAAV